MHLGKDGTLEINSLTEFWLKLDACTVLYTMQAFVFHPCKIQRPGDEAME